MAQARGILFTAFEPSGDEHAAPVIARLRQERPDLRLWALGGPRMQAAGAEIIETTMQSAAMLLGPVRQIGGHLARLKRLEAWMADKELAGVVPVDSPAANWSICSLVRRRRPQARIIHLVAPQLWAWAPWRIRKMRRLSDHVLCLLPFEKAWFEARGVTATFVGHPVFSPEAAQQRSEGPGSASTAQPARLALLPGSRTGEVGANWPTMLGVFQELRRQHPQLCGQVAAVDGAIAELIGQEIARRYVAPPPSQELEVRVGQIDAVLDWAELALAVSGTVTLRVAARRRPMVIFYNVPRWQAWLAPTLIRTRTFALPNLIAERAGAGRIVPEFIPHFGQVQPLVGAIDRLITDGPTRQAQTTALARLADSFAGRSYPAEAAAAILRFLA